MPTREIFWQVQGRPLFYLLVVLAIIVAARGCYAHVRRWQIGTGGFPTVDVRAGIRDVLAQVFLHRRLLKERYAGIMHAFLFSGFCFLGLASAMVMLRADFGLPVYEGLSFLFTKFTANLFGMLAIAGIAMAAYRRYIKQRIMENRREDATLLGLLALILVTGFFLEAVHIAAVPTAYDSVSLLGSWLAVPLAAWGATTLGQIYGVLWWVHAVLVLGLIAWLPYAKFFHVLMVPLNIFCRRRSVSGVYPLIDFEDEDLETYGKEKIEEFSEKTLMDSDACVRCGRCERNCPAHLTGKKLSPKDVTQKFRTQMEDAAARSAAKTAAVVDEADQEATAEVSSQDGTARAELNGEVITPEELWACTTCRACEAQCPAFVGHVDRLIELRRNAVLMEKPFPEEAKQAFRNLENNGNPWGIGAAKRGEFLASLGVKTIDEEPEAEYLFWPGCFGAFDARTQKVTRALVALLRAAGISFAILGEEETCCGDSARALGNEYLYTMLAEQNIETMNGYGVKKIITQCPHCYHTLKYAYPQLGGSYEVVHHTELLARLVAGGALQLSGKDSGVVAWHDSCYLGRYHGIYEQPRTLLQAAGLTVVEMKHHHGQSFCCGAGGGHMWLEEQEGSPINQARAREALALQPEKIAAACPFCLTMLEDGVSRLVADGENKPQVLDLAEILAQQIHVQPLQE